MGVFPIVYATCGRINPLFHVSAIVFNPLSPVNSIDREKVCLMPDSNGRWCEEILLKEQLKTRRAVQINLWAFDSFFGPPA
jgi:hypothetical protein